MTWNKRYNNDKVAGAAEALPLAHHVITHAPGLLSQAWDAVKTIGHDMTFPSAGNPVPVDTTGPYEQFAKAVNHNIWLDHQNEKIDATGAAGWATALPVVHRLNQLRQYLTGEPVTHLTPYIKKNLPILLGLTEASPGEHTDWERSDPKRRNPANPNYNMFE